MDDEQQLSALLERAAAGPEFTPPPLSVFTEHHKRKPARRRSTLALIGAAYIAVVIAIPLIVVAISRSGTSSPAPAAAPTAPSAATAAEIAGYTWSSLPPAPIAGRSRAVSVWTGRQMLVWGGQGADGTHFYNDGASYDPVTKQWQQLPPSPLSPRIDAAYVWTGDSLFVWGGYTSGAAQRATDGALYNPSNGKWTMVPSVPISSYQQIQAIWTEKGVVLLSTQEFQGGEQPAETVDARYYDEASDTWTSLPSLVSPTSQPMQFFQAVGAGDSIYLWSDWAKTTVFGPDGTTTRSGIAGYTLDLAGRKWTANSLAPTNGSTATPIWTGTNLIAPATYPYCGGCAGGIARGLSAALIDPESGSQRRLSHGPFDDGYPRSLWTGRALLTFNGQTAAALDLETATWRSTVAAPLTGGDLAVVWTGKALLSWGLMFAPSKANSQVAPTLRAAGQQLGP